jgi:biotin carboxylase
MSERVLIIAPHGSYRTFPYIEAAERLGVSVLIASEGKHSVVGAYAQGLHIDCAAPDAALRKILSEAAKRPFVGIVGTDDASTELAAIAAKALDLPHNEPQAVAIARRKDKARERLQAAGVQVPAFRKVAMRDASQAAAEVGFPCVVKPLALSASRGVIRVDDEPHLERACQRLSGILDSAEGLDGEERSHIVIERFVPGEEVAVEGMLKNGVLEILAIFDKPDPLDGPFFEETYYVMPSRHSAEAQAGVERCVAQACAAYGLREGPVHAECRINEHGVWLIEMAARTIGGLCARLLRYGTGHGLEELVVAQACGRQIQTAIPTEAAGVLMLPIPRAGVLRRVEGLLAAQRVPYIEEVTILVREGHQLVPLPEGSSYLGFVFARAPSPALAEAALRDAHAQLNVVVAPMWQAQVA